jgi:hypothetical protein
MSEEKYPEMAQRIETRVAPESQADPKFQTPLAFTRMTAQAVLAPAGIFEVLQHQLHIVFGTS